MFFITLYATDQAKMTKGKKNMSFSHVSNTYNSENSKVAMTSEEST